MIKDLEYFLKKLFLSESYLLKKRIKRSIKNKEERELELIKIFSDKKKDAIGISIHYGEKSLIVNRFYRLFLQVISPHIFEVFASCIRTVE